MIAVNTVTELDGTTDEVWQVLTDLDRFREWNPFIREAHGSTQVGDTVHVRVAPSFGGRIPFRARIVARDEGHELRWRGKVLGKWLASGDHVFTVEDAGEGRVRFVQRETFGGLLPWLGARLLAREAQRGFSAMNHALVERIADIRARQEAS